MTFQTVVLLLVACWLVGLALLAVEVLVVPGLGAPGVIGTGLMLFACFLALRHVGPLWGMLTILASLGIIVLGARAVGLAFGHRLVLGDGLGDDGGRSEELLGLEGSVIAPLRPAGIGRFGLKRLDITSRNEFLRRGAHVRIIGLEGNRIVVEALED